MQRRHCLVHLASLTSTFRAVHRSPTPEATNVKSTSWATALSTVTLAHNATTTLSGAPGVFDINLSGGTPFTYTGGGLYVAFDWGAYAGTLSTTAVIYCNTALANGLKGANGQGTTVAASTFRPETRLSSFLQNDVAVKAVYSFGELPLGNAPPQNIKAVGTNNGATAQSNVAVTLNITGAETFSDTQVDPSLAACGGQATVTFAAFTPSIAGSDFVQRS